MSKFRTMLLMTLFLGAAGCISGAEPTEPVEQQSASFSDSICNDREGKHCGSYYCNGEEVGCSVDCGMDCSECDAEFEYGCD